MQMQMRLGTHCSANTIEYGSGQQTSHSCTSVDQASLSAMGPETSKLDHGKESIACQCVWDNNESAPAVIRNSSPDHDSRRSSVCLGRIQLGCRHSPGLLLTNTRPLLAPKQNPLSSENTTDLHSVLQ
ncbi:uncharacterized protein TNCV_3296111 [Trichonephila clavipes]|uniref:Uncharacterized protein n=1 Tax=Trichonephila clavipes TaxID=2585209 RepID=A0A8X6VKC0_TRICX|nr:uncharacterized protein TNCV_3296111 [Trichonephila clavipes]